jgi:hypothetical protein
MTTMSKDVSVASKPHGMAIRQAEGILGRDNVYLPGVLGKKFADLVPGGPEPVPFSVRRLELARKRQALVYNPPEMTLGRLLGMTDGRFHGRMPIFLSSESCASDDFFHNEELRPGWMLIDVRMTQDWFNEDFLSQTRIVGRHMKVFADESAEAVVRTASNEFEAQSLKLGTEIKGLYHADPGEQIAFASTLVGLKLNRFRPTAVEVVWTALLREAAVGELILEDHLAWTQSLGTEGIIRVGRFGKRGGIVNFKHPTYSNESTGMLLCQHASSNNAE